MKPISKSILALGVIAFSHLTFAQTQPVDHAAHHTGDISKSSAAVAANAEGKVKMADMDTHLKAMQAMHEKMGSAKNPEQQQALMAEQMKLMQDGMTMMKNMGADMKAMSGKMNGMNDIKPQQAGKPMGMGGMGMMGGEMMQHHQMMLKRMEMMESMMQMMVDRLSTAPTTAK
ncbi:hypothetical protein [Ottowia testudinis]|uniref:Signal recognition particle subunit FFH/SRP54 (Srp54) n=1 Tax=Ottowia testudinis TaxID=2816950 RepID=A0A975CEW2_9BURK|nr:hypothetical protein [Ottowia testudinis]QTD44950.1 hypothetical protein J1M35_18165 [Ottowia testudinis]